MENIILLGRYSVKRHAPKSKRKGGHCRQVAFLDIVLQHAHLFLMRENIYCHYTQVGCIKEVVTIYRQIWLYKKRFFSGYLEYACMHSFQNCISLSSFMSINVLDIKKNCQLFEKKENVNSTNFFTN